MIILDSIVFLHYLHCNTYFQNINYLCSPTHSQYRLPIPPAPLLLKDQ
nr:MAG TPA: hypothetical protein [Caudoviricetes sp.]